MRFGYGPAHEAKRRLLTFWNCAKFFVDYANVSPDGEAGDLEPLDRWLLARVEQLVAEATDAYERYWTPDVVASFEASWTTCPTGTSAAPAGGSGTATPPRSRR